MSDVIERHKVKAKRYRIVQSGELIKDEFDPYKKWYFMSMTYKYEGKTYNISDSFMSDNRIYSTLLCIEDSAIIERRNYFFEDLIKPYNDKVPCPIVNTGGSATDCQALSCGDCKIGKACYAYRDEHMYKSPLLYRRRQEIMFRNMSAMEYAENLLENIGKSTEVRFNESGDVRSLEDIEKMNEIAMYLSYYGITSYTYTAMSSLNIPKQKYLTIIGSSVAGLDGMFIMSTDAASDTKLARKQGFDSWLCPGDCYICSVCPSMKDRQRIIFAQKH